MINHKRAEVFLKPMIVFFNLYSRQICIVSAFDKMQRRPDLKNWVFIRDRTLLLKATQQSMEKTPTSRHRQKTSATAPHFDFWTWQSLQTGWLTQSSVSSVYIKIQEHS